MPLSEKPYQPVRMVRWGADNAQQTLELLAVRLDTPLWLVPNLGV